MKKRKTLTGLSYDERKARRRASCVTSLVEQGLSKPPLTRTCKFEPRIRRVIPQSQPRAKPRARSPHARAEEGAAAHTAEPCDDAPRRGEILCAVNFTIIRVEREGESDYVTPSVVRKFQRLLETLNKRVQTLAGTKFFTKNAVRAARASGGVLRLGEYPARDRAG